MTTNGLSRVEMAAAIKHQRAWERFVDAAYPHYRPPPESRRMSRNAAVAAASLAKKLDQEIMAAIGE